MNKIILGATFVAIAALVGSPILAEAIEELNGVKVRTDADGNFDGIVFRTQDVVPTNGTVFGGYAIPTENGDFIAVTSHQGMEDSISQVDETDPIWHSHLVQASTNPSCDDLAIDALSFEEPSTKVTVRNTNIMVKIIANGTASYTDAISGNPTDFTVGNAIDRVIGAAINEAGIVESISFDLNVAADDTICIGPLVE